MSVTYFTPFNHSCSQEKGGNGGESAGQQEACGVGELPNLLSVVVSVVEPRKPKCKTKTKAKNKKALAMTQTDTTKNIDEKLDVDGKSGHDPQLCVAYASDIYDYLRKMEVSVAYAFDIYEYLLKMEVEPKRRPLPDYLEKVQKDVSANMRGMLVDWLVEVADRGIQASFRDTLNGVILEGK